MYYFFGVRRVLFRLVLFFFESVNCIEQYGVVLCATSDGMGTEYMTHTANATTAIIIKSTTSRS